MLSKIIDGGRRILDQGGLIKGSGLLDTDWYVARYPEAGAAENAPSHFLTTGAAKGYDPGPKFSTRAYLTDHPDVRAAGTNPLLHYLRYGQFEGRIIRDTHGRPSGSAGETFGEAGEARLREAFDPAFYVAANPDLAEGIDVFAHFMGEGWHQGRDPAPWFSVEHYLRTYPDVAGTGRNPFAHFLLTGCREGRSVARSRQRQYTPGKTSEGAPRLAALAMVKNEADIIRAFTQHVLALFDDIVIVDHGSEDGTAEFLAALAAANRRVRVLTLEEPSYIQSVTMTHLVRERTELREADWVFILDADEFLPFPDRAEFQAALHPFQGCPVLAMHWQNLIPTTYWDSRADLTDDTTFLQPPTPSPFRKVAFQPGRVALDRAVIAQGNHGLFETLNGAEIPVFEADFPLLHVPVRSVDQLLLKLNQGVLAYQKMGGTRDAGQGTHWYQMKQATAETVLTADHLNAVADRYSEDKEAILPLDRAALGELGYRETRFSLACHVDDALPTIEGRGLGEMLMRLYAQDFTGAAEEDTPSATRLRTHGTRLLRADDAAEYDKLPKPVAIKSRPGITDALSELLRPGYQGIEDLMPSDWNGHIPFMLALAGLARPRRFVELGTLRGASFFALAQAVRQGGFDCQALAVSGWAVEPERADDFRNVYEDFQFLARKYADFAGSLRMAPDDAALRFADGSIDLLHLDGFYTYESLTATLETWLPKLSDAGLLLVHDIHAHGGDFGVWRVWEDLVARFPTLEFRHSQGLGLAAVGTKASPEVICLAKAVAKDPALQTLLQEHFARLGALSTELFSRRYDMARMDLAGAAGAAQTEELTWLRQELATARTEADDLRALVEGGLRRAAG